MKKLLTIITLSALVGTSASSLTPMFAQKIVNHNLKSNQINNKDISITNENDTNPFTPKKLISGIPNNVVIKIVNVASNGTVYVGTRDNNYKGVLYKSTDGINFQQIKNGINNELVISIVIGSDNTVYAGTNNGLYKSIDAITFSKMNVTNDAITSLNVDKDNSVYAGTNNGVIYKINGTSFQNIGDVEKQIWSLAIDSNKNIYVGTQIGLYKSNNGKKFEQINKKIINGAVYSIDIDYNNNIYVENDGLWIINPINLLVNIIKPDTFDKSWPLYNGIVYNSAQKIDIKENLVASATLDGKSKSIPTTNLDIPVGEHNLILTLKDKTLASVFGGDINTGQVIYKLWVKTSIDKNKIDYQTKIDDTQLYTGLISNAGNTNMKDIIQTKIKDGWIRPILIRVIGNCSPYFYFLYL